MFDWLTHPNVQTLFAAFGDTPLRFVGGCVRDSLMGRNVADKDAATPATPEEVIALLGTANIKSVPTGIDHGTITAVIEGEPFEITTLRRDVSCDGRHAEVAFTDDWQEDAARRDFTMNALYCDADGHIYDYYNGEIDARSGVVTFIGDAHQRIEEDGLRILRFFRFYATLGAGEPDAASLAACQQLAEKLVSISGERIRNEMLKLLAADNAATTLAHMAPILRIILPDQDYDVTLLKAPLPDITHKALLRLALLLRQTERPEASVAQIVKRWQMSRREQRMLSLLVSHAPIHLPEDAMGWMPLRRLHHWDEFSALAWQEILVQSGDPETLQQQLAELQETVVPQLPIRGGDLKQHGVAEGAEMGEMLRRAERYWESKAYKPSRMDLIHYVKSLRRA